MAPWKGLATAAILVALTQPTGLLAAQPNEKRQAEIAELVADLGHEQFARREMAVERLVLAEGEAFLPLLAAAQSDNSEVVSRATSVLQQISPKLSGQLLHDSLEAIEKVDSAQHPHLAGLVADFEARARHFKHEQALAKIRALGAMTEEPTLGDEPTPASASKTNPAAAETKPTEPSEPAVAPGPGDAAPPPAGNAPPQLLLPEAVAEVAPPIDDLDEPAPPPDFLPTTAPGELPRIEGEIADAFVGQAEIGGEGPAAPENAALNPVPAIWLTKKWRGGDDGLVHLKDIPELGELGLLGADISDAGLKYIADLQNLSYLTVQGTRITSAGLRQLRNQRPMLIIKAIGRTKIGISAEVEGDRCRVASVNPGSAAETAGLMAGDYVLRADDVEVSSFIDLMIATFDRAPGHKLRLEIERNGERQTTVVELAPRQALAVK